MKKIMLIGIIVFILYFALLCVSTHQGYFPTTKGLFFNEYWDRSLHYLRGSWYPLHEIPYTGVFSEQLPMATYLFALPFVFMPRYDIEKTSTYFMVDSLPFGDRNFPLIRPSLYKSFYMIIFSFFMAIFGLISLYLLLLFLKIMGKNINYAIIFLLPMVLYFVFNRFDIFPALMGLLALYSVYKEKYNLAAVLLAVGVMTKAYLLVCLPIYLVYYYCKYKKINFSMIFLFIAACFLVLLPLLIRGGVKTLSVPFNFQLGRDSNVESLYFFISLFFPRTFQYHSGLIKSIFLALSLSVIPFAVTAKIDNFKPLLKWSLLAVLIFMLFMKFYSPQWIIWVIFLLILNIESRNDMVKIILFQVLTYLCFPIAFAFFGGTSIQFIILAVIRTIILISLIAPLISELFPTSSLYNFLIKPRLIR